MEVNWGDVEHGILWTGELRAAHFTLAGYFLCSLVLYIELHLFHEGVRFGKISLKFLLKGVGEEKL